MPCPCPLCWGCGGARAQRWRGASERGLGHSRDASRSDCAHMSGSGFGQTVQPRQRGAVASVRGDTDRRAERGRFLRSGVGTLRPPTEPRARCTMRTTANTAAAVRSGSRLTRARGKLLIFVNPIPSPPVPCGRAQSPHSNRHRVTCVHVCPLWDHRNSRHAERPRSSKHSLP